MPKVFKSKHLRVTPFQLSNLMLAFLFDPRSKSIPILLSIGQNCRTFTLNENKNRIYWKF